MPDRLFVIDGMAYAFRAYYAIRNLRDSSGRPVNAVFGFARILLKILRDHEPSHIVIVFDAPGRTFRDEMYPEYKANRDETPAVRISQFPMIDELIEAFTPAQRDTPRSLAGFKTAFGELTAALPDVERVVVLVDDLLGRAPFAFRSDGDWGAVLVAAGDHQDAVAAQAVIPREHIGG